MLFSYRNLKCNNDSRGIILVHVLCKTVTGLLNCHLISEIHFHDALHGFWAGRGMGISAPKSKLLQNLTVMREAVIYKIFLDLQKAYGALDWDRCIEILAEYGVGPRELQIPRMY